LLAYCSGFFFDFFFGSGATFFVLSELGLKEKSSGLQRFDSQNALRRTAVRGKKNENRYDLCFDLRVDIPCVSAAGVDHAGKVSDATRYFQRQTSTRRVPTQL